LEAGIADLRRGLRNTAELAGIVALFLEAADQGLVGRVADDGVGASIQL
jgi:hypothetical protein